MTMTTTKMLTTTTTTWRLTEEARATEEARKSELGLQINNLRVIARRQLTIQINLTNDCNKTAYSAEGSAPRLIFLLDVNITKWLWFTNITKQYAYTQFKDVPWCVGWHIVNSGDIAICWHFSFTHSLIGNLKTCSQDHNHYNYNYSTAPVCSLRKSGRSFSRN